jgi:uncharacterized domain HDIG
MSKNRLGKDLYDKNGVLLLSEGQELTEEMIKKLEQMDYTDIRNMIYKDNNTINFDDVKNNTGQLRKILNINDSKIINSSSKVVMDILFDSKSKPWWLYINTLSNYVDWLYTHSINVSIISVMIAEIMGTKLELEDIALGAFLHDIGKLMIPKNIIQKPGQLDNDELYYIRQHCELGISMVKNFGLSQLCLDIIYQHHERLDGSGYPQGLMAAQIPVHTRIVMIADILDAITTYRPYKETSRLESALNELKKGSDQYPQEIIEAFSTLLS